MRGFALPDLVYRPCKKIKISFFRRPTRSAYVMMACA
jgi:hypothetical protein